MSSTARPASRPRFPAPGWWLRDRHGDVAVAQPPNPALAVWLACSVITWADGLSAGRAETITYVGEGALTAWALDELLRGSSPVRRVLGAALLPVLVWRILH